LDDLAQGLQLAEALPSHPIPPARLGNGAATNERGERRIGIIPPVQPLLPPPLHQFGHGNAEVRIDAMPRLDMDNHTPQICQFHVLVLRTSDAEEMVRQVKMGVNTHVGLAQSHEVHDVQDP
jgi:hypothetical protein